MGGAEQPEQVYICKGFGGRLTDCQSKSVVLFAGAVLFEGVVPFAEEVVSRLPGQTNENKLWLTSRDLAVTGSTAVAAMATARSSVRAVRPERSSPRCLVDLWDRGEADAYACTTLQSASCIFRLYFVSGCPLFQCWYLLARKCIRNESWQERATESNP